ncbi:MAG: LysR family transcriptional regulator [Gammaproteobacteria bacterium]|nr:LysR family transcriptional regulator [Gammaproteobacteria bacterium]
MDEIGEDLHRVLNRVRLRQLALLLALQEQGTLSAAAREMGMSQPAATKMLRELESALGYRLFERVARGLQLTAAGQTTLAHVRAVRGTLQALLRDLAAASGRGSLSVGSIMAPSPTILTQAVKATQEALAGLTIRITIDTSERLVERLELGHLDLVVGRLPEGHSRRDFRVELLAQEALAIVASPGHALARRRRLRVADLAAGRWVLPPRDTPARELLEREFRLANLDMPAGPVETPAIFTTANLVVGGDHLALLPLSVARQFADNGMMVILPLALSARLEPFGTILRRGRPVSAAARHFLETIHRIALAVE